MKVAITGGIGAGKSYVCRRLADRGVTVYDCDAAAKRLMHTSDSLMAALKQLVGDEVYLRGDDGAPVLNKPALARFLLASAENAQAVDDIVHPAVARDFEMSGMQWIESAIFFDSGFNRRISVDCVVCVTAPLEVRIRRVMERDGISREKALDWIARQLPQEEVLRRSDYEIVNDGRQSVDSQIDTFFAQTDNKNKTISNE